MMYFADCLLYIYFQMHDIVWFVYSTVTYTNSTPINKIYIIKYKNEVCLHGKWHIASKA